jgi:hypothetical protein
VLTALFKGMRERRQIRVEGSVTETLLRNLEDFQEIWALWRPKYAPIEIVADEIVDDQRAETRKGVFAYSGGVDATFALLRHHRRKAGRRNVEPVCAVLVHGFDIPLTHQEAFERAHRSAADVARLLGVPLSTVRTNWKTEASKDWEMEFGAGLAACLHQFHSISSVGVFGSDEDCAHLALPWGSNPITNRYLSGGNFDLLSEGDGFTRTERVRQISEYPAIAAKLRSCWEGPISGGNCGICEKCVRTQMNFMANGCEPICFDGGPTNAQILSVKASNRIQIAYLREILSSARKNGVRGSWLAALSLTIAKNETLLPFRGLEKRMLYRLRGLAKTVSAKGRHPRPAI